MYAEGFARYGKVSVTDSRLELSGDPGGGVYIRGGEVVIDSSHIFSDGSGVEDGGDFVFKGDSVTVGFGEIRVGGAAGSGQPRIRTVTTGSGHGGDIRFDADRVTLDGGVRIVSVSAGIGRGGNITINALHMLDLLNSDITTSVQGGAGGNINIDPQFVIVQNSNVIANAFGGPGGNIDIVAGLFLIDPSSVISASSALGIDGIINVDSPVVDVTSGVTELPANVLDASTLVQAPCAARTAGGTWSRSTPSPLRPDSRCWIRGPSPVPRWIFCWAD